MESYVERPPGPGLAGVVRTVWIQRTGAAAYVQRHLPTGGVEIHFPIGGGQPRLIGPLTGPEVEVIPARSTIVGVRFQPGTAPPLPTVLDDLVDQRVGLAELWGSSVDRLEEAMARAQTPERALAALQAHLRQEFRRAGPVDSLVREAVQSLMPWHPVNIDTLATHLTVSPSQLRRRCLQAVGLSPKALQRTLRFQGFLALAQAGATASGRRGADGVAGLAVDVGYADQAHLSRECLRLTGLTPRQLLGGRVDRCSCGHEHSASYQPFLAGRSRPPLLALTCLLRACSICSRPSRHAARSFELAPQRRRDMSKVFSAHAVSVDGYISGRTPDGEEEFGRGLGDAPMLFDWYFDGDTPSQVFDGFKLSEPSARFFDAVADRVGATVAGRTTYEHSSHWGGGGPHPTAPLFVLSHRPAPGISEQQTLVMTGIADAIAAARAAAGDQDVALMGGSALTSGLEAGLVDEVILHQVPVLLGGGRRFFQELPKHVQLRLLEAVAAPGVTHLRYEVVR